MKDATDSLAADDTEFLARIIGALGQLMTDFHHRDLAVQNAVSDMTCTPDAKGMHLADLQHIDLVTQTHADLARFLPRLAQGLRDSSLSEAGLANTLTLRSLEDALLRAPLAGDVEHVIDDEIDPGDMDLF